MSVTPRRFVPSSFASHSTLLLSGFLLDDLPGVAARSQDAAWDLLRSSSASRYVRRLDTRTVRSLSRRSDEYQPRISPTISIVVSKVRMVNRGPNLSRGRFTLLRPFEA